MLYSVVGYGIVFADFEYNPNSYYDRRDDKKTIAKIRNTNYCMCRYTKLRDIIHELYRIPKERLCMWCLCYFLFFFCACDDTARLICLCLCVDFE